MTDKEYRVDGKVAIVTGAGRGLGEAIALSLADAGADIVVVSRTEEQLRRTAEKIQKLGQRALAISADVSKKDEVEKVVEETISQLGKIDILCNNAGTVMSKPVAFVPEMEIPEWLATMDQGEAKSQTLEDWHRVIDTNVTSAFLFAQAAGPYMLKQRQGKVINTSSTSAEEGTPYFSAYCASKAALSSFTRCLASEWGPFNINVNAIAPGIIKTHMSAPFLDNPEITKGILDIIPLGRVGKPRDIALLALFLASSASDYITGQVFTVDGGAMGRGPDI